VVTASDLRGGLSALDNPIPHPPNHPFFPVSVTHTPSIFPQVDAYMLNLTLNDRLHIEVMLLLYCCAVLLWQSAVTDLDVPSPNSGGSPCFRIIQRWQDSCSHPKSTEWHEKVSCCFAGCNFVSYAPV